MRWISRVSFGINILTSAILRTYSSFIHAQKSPFELLYGVSPRLPSGAYLPNARRASVRLLLQVLLQWWPVMAEVFCVSCVCKCPFFVVLGLIAVVACPDAAVVAFVFANVGFAVVVVLCVFQAHLLSTLLTKSVLLSCLSTPWLNITGSGKIFSKLANAFAQIIALTTRLMICPAQVTELPSKYGKIDYFFRLLVPRKGPEQSSQR